MADTYSGSVTLTRGIHPTTVDDYARALHQARAKLDRKLEDHGRDPRRYPTETITVTVTTSA